MAYKALIFQVMVASPGDVSKERQVVKDVIGEWNDINASSNNIVLMPVGWETHSAPSMSDRAQEIINKQVLEDSDLLIGVFWTRIGTPTGEHISGSVEEIKKHISSGKPAMLYFSSAPVHPDSVDQEQYAQLKAFKEECKAGGLIEEYESISEFRNKFSRQLAINVNKDDYIRSQMTAYEMVRETSIGEIDNHSQIDIPELSSEAKTLLIEVSEDKNGTLMKLLTFGGLNIQTNGKQLVDRGNPRSEATWRYAVEQLEYNGLIQDVSYKGEIFNITDAGYKVADILKMDLQ